ncbi:MAG: DNA replication/repair protein RecF [Candidatus Kapabacteria bacterium]|nr:DNA replication/repair protein RecF [Candidatus Kapabacteria bacterium]
MIIDNILIRNVRNHFFTEIEFNGNVNVIYGKNGAGKTSILESISIGSLSKSFISGSDSNLVSKGEEFYEVQIQSTNELNLRYFAKVKYQLNNGKTISNSYGDNLTPKELIGTIPLIILTPDYRIITSGSPQSRRDFVDRILSQSNKVYLDELLKFKKALKQRNNILLQNKLNNSYNSNSQFDEDLLDVWTNQFINHSSELIFRRLQFVKEIQPHFSEFYGLVSNNSEAVSLEYQPNLVFNNSNSNSNSLDKNDLKLEDIRNKLNQKYKNLKFEEIKRGTTLFGPQKDEFLIKINNNIAREFASQGQHKTLLISLKFAEFQYLKNKRNEIPIFLLDDIFSEIDSYRIKMVIELLRQNSSQIFITTTNPKQVEDVFNQESIKFIHINDGKVQNE